MDAEKNQRRKNRLTIKTMDKVHLATASETAPAIAFKGNAMGNIEKSLIRNGTARKKNSRSFLTHRGSRRATKDPTSKKDKNSVRDGSDKTAVGGIGRHLAESEGIVEVEEIQGVTNVIIELCENPGDPEVTSELPTKNSYAIINYRAHPEGVKAREEETEESDKSVSIGQLSEVERMLLNGSFELIDWDNSLAGKESSSREQSNEAGGTDRISIEIFDGSTSSTNGRLAEQLRAIRNQDGLYVCVFCSKAFRRKYPLRDHMKTHTGDAPTCSVCNKIFPKSHNLMLHMRTHTGEKPYECEVCGKGFADKSNLKVHIRKHTGERPYKCELCNRGFINSSGLVLHRRLHTGARHFTCGSCDELFCTKSQLQYHLKKVHLTRTCHRCQYCSKFYASVNNLRCHLMNLH